MADAVHEKTTVGLVALVTALTAAGFTARSEGLGWLRDRLRAPAGPAAPVIPARGAPGAVTPSAPAVVPPPPSPPPPRGALPRVPVLDPCVARRENACVRRALSRFDEAVAHDPLLRVAHIGDSIVADDKITARLRARFQARLGDGGPGFVFAAPPSRWYHHRLVRVSARGWDVRSVVADRAEDARHGYGGATAEGRDGAVARYESVGGPVSRVEVHYATGPERGALAMVVDDAVSERVSARGELGDAAWSLARPARAISLRAEGSARVHGVVMERARGAVIDNLGLVGNSARAMLANDESHARAALARRAPQLVIVLLGANEATHAYEGPRFEEGFRALLRRIRSSGASCLVMAPPDIGIDDGEAIRARETIPPVVEAERRAAMAEGCAFWDTFAFMGGRGSVASWRRWQWVEPDLTHPTAGGGARIADALFDALFARRREDP